MTMQSGQLWPLETVAGHLGLTVGSTRHWLSRHGITAARRAPGNLALYDATRVRNARAEQLRKVARRDETQHWRRRA